MHIVTVLLLMKDNNLKFNILFMIFKMCKIFKMADEKKFLMVFLKINLNFYGVIHYYSNFYTSLLCPYNYLNHCTGLWEKFYVWIT